MSTVEQTMERVEFGASIDYLKFIIKTDADTFQGLYMMILNAVNSALAAGDHKPCKITALGEEASGLRRYVVEVWGRGAQLSCSYFPASWFNNLYRLDVREEVPEIESPDLYQIRAFVSVLPTGRIGTNTFATRPAKKTDGRDIGGVGVRWGSRKSDKHAVLYKRGSERTAFEFRLQGKAAQEIGRKLFKESENYDNYSLAHNLIMLMQWERRKFLSSLYNFTDPAQLMQLAERAAVTMPMMMQPVDQKELDEARAWWSELTEDEQREYQNEKFTPTPKGMKD